MNISFIPWESRFPESHEPLSTSNLFVSGLASHFSDHRSTCFPDACSWKAPRTLPNQCTQRELSSIPQLLSCFCQPSHRRPPHLPNGQSQKPKHHPKCLPHHTLSTQMVPKTMESQPQHPSNLSASHLLPGDDTCLLSGHSMLSLSHSPTQLPTVAYLLFPAAIRCSSHHLQKEAPPQKRRRPKHRGQPSNSSLSSNLSCVLPFQPA